MNRVTITQRIQMIKIYYKNGDSATATYRALGGDNGLHIASSNFASNWQKCEEI